MELIVKDLLKEIQNIGIKNIDTLKTLDNLKQELAKKNKN